MKTLQGESAKMLADSEEMRDISNASQSVIGRLEQKFGQFYDSAITTLSGTRFAQNISFASLVKVDHVIYKQRAYVLINDSSRGDFREAVNVDHHSCRLGKWYEGEGKAVFGDSPSYRLLEDPHTRVHDCIHHIVKQLNQGWENNELVQDQIYASLTGAENASLEAMSMIDQIVSDKHPNMVKQACIFTKIIPARE